MMYQSKKNPEVYANLDSENDKYKTVSMTYLTGDNATKSFDISTSTFKRWWKKVSDEEANEAIINTPYHPNVTPHYIPKPQSVIEYEENKNKARYNSALPDFDAIVEMFGQFCSKVNETSKYIKFTDGSTLWRKGNAIDIYCTEKYFEPLTMQGLTSKPNKDKVRPFAFHIVTEEEFEKAKGVLGNATDEEVTETISE